MSTAKEDKQDKMRQGKIPYIEAEQLNKKFYFTNKSMQ